MLMPPIRETHLLSPSPRHRCNRQLGYNELTFSSDNALGLRLNNLSTSIPVLQIRASLYPESSLSLTNSIPYMPTYWPVATFLVERRRRTRNFLHCPRKKNWFSMAARQKKSHAMNGGAAQANCWSARWLAGEEH